MGNSSIDTTEYVIQLRKDLAAAGAGGRTEEVKSILKQLRKEIVATESLIRVTKIGLSVGKLRQNSNKEIADLAKEIVKKWKNDVGSVRAQASGASSKSDSTGQSPTSASTPAALPTPTTPASTSTPPTSATVNEPTSSKTAPNKIGNSTGNPRTGKTDGIKFEVTGDSTRDKCMALLYDALAFDSAAPSDVLLGRSKEIEAQIQIISAGNNANYTKKMRSMYSNIKDKNNPALRGSIVSGQISAERLAAMTPQEMASEERKAEDLKIAQENLFKAKGAEQTGTETDIFQCGRCKQNKTTYVQMQTRSADEPMTTFVTCKVCGNRWKFS